MLFTRESILEVLPKNKFSTKSCLVLVTNKNKILYRISKDVWNFFEKKWNPKEEFETGNIFYKIKNDRQLKEKVPRPIRSLSLASHDHDACFVVLPYTAAYGDLVMGEGDNGKRVGDGVMVALAQPPHLYSFLTTTVVAIVSFTIDRKTKVWSNSTTNTTTNRLSKW